MPPIFGAETAGPLLVNLELLLTDDAACVAEDVDFHFSKASVSLTSFRVLAFFLFSLKGCF